MTTGTDHDHRRRRLRTSVVPGSAVSDDDLRHLYDLAGHLAQVRPGCEERHWRDYQDFAREGEVVRFTSEGRPEGFFMRRGGTGEQAGRPFRWTQDEYYFIDPAWRHHAGPELERVRQFVRVLRQGGPPCYFVGEVYPASYLVARGAFGRLITQRGGEGDPWERELLLRLGTRIAGDRLDRDSGLVRTDTIPPPAPEHFATSRHAAAFQDYERLNPEWRDGWTLVFLARIEPRVIFRLLAASGDRVLAPIERAVRRMRRTDG